MQEYLESSKSKTYFEKEKGLSSGCISKWLSILALEDKPKSTEIAIMKERMPIVPETEAQEEISRLRQQLREKEMELKKSNMLRDAYAKMIEIAETKYAIPIRKNSRT